jgi:phosphodiesterase/alkaline phosphatase D-like protein
VCAWTSVLAAADFQSGWQGLPDRPWIGPEFWSNPLQDWRIHGGRLECIAAGGDRNVFLLTRELSLNNGSLAMNVRLGRLESDTGALNDGYVGFRMGVRGAFKDYRDSAVRGTGLNAGLSMDGRLFLGKLELGGPRLDPPFQDLELRLSVEPATGGYNVRLQAYNSQGRELAKLEKTAIPAEWFQGGIALVCHSGDVLPMETLVPKVVETGWVAKPMTHRGGTVRFWFRDWKVSGSMVTAHPDRAFGPILFAMHTLHKRVLKLTAQMAPVEQSSRAVALEIRKPGSQDWSRAGEAAIDPLSRTATFRIAGWDDTRDTPYRLVYGGQRYKGVVRKDPRDKKQIVVAAFTGNNDFGFPHADVVRNVSHFKPDLLAYTGDNIYERVGEYGIQRAPVETAALDYLRKWYLFGWEYRDLLKEIPAVCLPDDHDVYHGNIWGAGGRRAVGEGFEGQDQGGYTMPAEWVNAVQRTQTSHMPDPYDPTPIDQGITVYYGPLLYGGVSFAIIEDRKWKSAPKPSVPKGQIINGWPQNPEYNAARDGDLPGLELLGGRQEEFLEKWAADWSGGAWMKAVISQTIFANVATLPKGSQADDITPKLPIQPTGGYAPDETPVPDHDSNGWPQTPRTRALRSMRKGFAFHIAGDQHLGSTIQYGIEDWNDGGWALCVPSVANVWPRRWFPESPGRNRKPGAPRYTGEYLDGFGNKITVHAISNPHRVPYQPVAITERAPGYGMVTFDRETRKITIANWPRWVDVTKPGAQPYPGWPITIDQLDNGFPKNGVELDAVRTGKPDPVVQVADQDTGEIVYTLRIRGNNFTPRVPKAGRYTVRLLD